MHIGPELIVGPRLHQRDIEWPKTRPDLRKLWMQGGIAAVKETPRRPFPGPSSPERRILVHKGHRSPGEMPRRRSGDFHVTDAMVIPPIELDDFLRLDIPKLQVSPNP